MAGDSPVASHRSGWGSHRAHQPTTMESTGSMTGSLAGLATGTLTLRRMVSEGLVRPCAPFVSSTFRDFGPERDHLVKKAQTAHCPLRLIKIESQVFPRLDGLCRACGSYFAPVDLRWGVTHSAAQQGQVVRLCLEYIAECRPFFICILGSSHSCCTLQC